MLQKKEIIRCFNAGAKTYEHAADIQKTVANGLVKKLEITCPDTLLEIGCGTGLLSRQLATLFPNTELDLIDISPAMTQVCKNYFSTHKNINVYCLDGESLQSEKKYDLIVSSMTLHWFIDLQKSIDAIIKKLTPQGHFIFAMLGSHSLQEWKHCFDTHSVLAPTPPFPSHLELQRQFPTLKTQVEVLQQRYQNSYHFLQTLKLLGASASSANHTILSAGQLRKMMRFFDKQFSDEITVSYEVIYGIYS